MKFRKAEHNDLKKVMDLYESVKGTEFCTWNEYYPQSADADYDFETGNLYVMTKNNMVIGAISIVPDNELDNLNVWQINDDTVHEIARVVVNSDYQGNGIAYEMVKSIICHLKNNGCHAIHLSVADINIPALKTYKKSGFKIVGEADMYNSHYFLCEKII